MKQRIVFIVIIIFAFYVRSFGQTIPAPDLQCVVNNPTNGTITLYWTNPPPNACGAFQQYTIYASSNGPGGPYTPYPVASQAADSFVLTLSTAMTWYFYMEANYTCAGYTSLQSDTINNLNPITPVIVNVTVTPGSDVIINWEPSPSPQTDHYIIYYSLPNGNAVPLATVNGRFNTTYTDIAANPDSGSLTYTVAAVDSCGGISSFNTQPHNTIWLRARSTSCQKEIQLVWNKYINWPRDVKEYRVYANINQTGFVLSNTIDSSGVNFGYTNFSDGDSVCLFIQAISSDDTTIVSNSNIVCMRVSIVKAPSYIYMTNATVDLNNQVTISWIIDPTAELIFYKISRSGNGSTYNMIEQRPTPIPLLAADSTVDSAGVQPEKNAYYYKVTAFDSCQNQYETDYVKTVNLKGELYDYYVSHLTWNNFQLYGATVLHYNLYRNYGNGYQQIATIPYGADSTYTDSLQQFKDEKGIFCYRIEAVYNLDLPDANYHTTLSSWSNEVCIIHRPIIYIPNAFAPQGVNNVFKPTIIYGEPQAYSMQIYNRWGAKIFESNDPATGWDGTDHGKEAQQGGYAYLIQFKANDGVNVERKGMVLLVR